MNADLLGLLTVKLTLWSPLILIVLLFMTAGMAQSSKATDREVMGRWWFAVMLAAGTGFLGVSAIEPVEPGGWGFGVVAVPFIFCKWMLIGQGMAWAVLAGRDFVLRRIVIALFALVALALTYFSHSYLPAVARADRAFWDRAFRTNDAHLPAEVYKAHLSSSGREAIRERLHYHNDAPAEMLHLVVELVPDDLEIIVQQITIDAPLIEMALKQTVENRRLSTPGSTTADSLLLSLARNPATPPDVLRQLADDPSSSVRAEVARRAKMTLGEHSKQEAAARYLLDHDPDAR